MTNKNRIKFLGISFLLTELLLIITVIPLVRSSEGRGGSGTFLCDCMPWFCLSFHTMALTFRNVGVCNHMDRSESIKAMRWVKWFATIIIPGYVKHQKMVLPRKWI